MTDLIFLAVAIASIALVPVLCLAFFALRRAHLPSPEEFTRRLIYFLLLLAAGTALEAGFRHQKDPFALQSILDALYCSLRMFFVDGTMEQIDAARLPEMLPQVMRSYYLTYYALCFLDAAFTTFAVLSFFRSVTERFKLRLLTLFRGSTYVFSELNDHTLAIATSVRKRRVWYRPTVIVFCDVYRHNVESVQERLQKAQDLNALCFREDICRVNRWVLGKQRKKDGEFLSAGKEPRFHYFLFGEDQGENVHQAMQLAKWENERWRCHRRLLISVLSSDEISGKIFDNLNQGQTHQHYCIRRIDRRMLLAWSVVHPKPFRLIDCDDKNENPDRDLKVLLVGAGLYGIAILRTLVWYYQRRSGKISVWIADRDPDTEDRLRGMMPALFDTSVPDGEDPNPEDAAYSLHFFPPCDVAGEAFAEHFAEAGPFDAIYVTLGEDDANANAALRLRTLCDRLLFREIVRQEKLVTDDTGEQRLTLCEPKRFCEIFAVIHSDMKAENLTGDGEGCKLLTGSAVDSHINVVGNHSSIYQYENLHNAREEAESKAAHLDRFPNQSYENSEYYVFSSLAHIKHLRFIEELYGKKALCDETGRITEECLRISKKQWNAYMRGIGYVPVDRSMTSQTREELFTSEEYRGSVRRHFARGKWHNSIVPFDQIGPKEQQNNVKESDLK